MIYLCIAILCSVSMSLIFKLSESGGSNRYAVTFFNSLGALCIATIFALGGTFFSGSWFPAFFAEAGEVFGQMGKFSSLASCGYAVLLAVAGGICSYIAYMVLQLCTARNGAAMTTTFNKVGSIVPMTLSVLFLHEAPKIIQVVGAAVAIAAIFIIYFKREAASVITMKIALLGTLFFGGFSDFITKLFETFGREEHQTLYVFYFFLFSSLVGLVAMLIKNRTIRRRDVIFGLITGIPAQFLSRFLLLALGQVPAFVVFPLYSVGTIVLVNVINLIFFKEPLTRRQFFAIGLMIVAVVLLNL